MSPTRVLLIHPEGSNGIAGQEDITTSINRVPPIALLCLGGYLEREGIGVALLDLYGAGNRDRQFALIERKMEARPAYVGFTATTSSVMDAYDKAVWIKERWPETKIVFGGVHVSALGEKGIDRFPRVDYAVIGEGEVPFTRLVKGEMDPATIPGIITRTASGETVYPGPNPDFVTLDELPLPSYHLLEGFPHEYALPILNSPAPKGAPLITSRGCPYTCAYCDRSVYGRSFRANTPAYILRHMEALYENYGVTHFNIYDDLFTLKRKRVVELCELLAAHPAPLTFNCSVRIGHVDEELLATLKRGGCYSVSLGIESGDQELLDRHKTGVNLDEVQATVAMINAAGLRAKGLFIMGLPGETPESARKTKEYVGSLGLAEMNLSKFAPFPGSPAFNEVREHGEFIEEWPKMNCLNFVFRPTAFATWEEMDTIYAEVVMGFYGKFNWWGKVLVPTLLRHPHNIVTILKNLPGLLKARRQFDFKIFPADGGVGFRKKSA